MITARMLFWAALAATLAAASSGAAAAASASLVPITKVMVVVLENTDFAQALRQPFLASLASRGVLLTNFTAEGHPSQPNYVALISGSTLGVTSDANVDLDRPHIGDLLEAKGLQWKAYVEGYPGNCFLGAAYGAYVRKHVPFLSFKDVQSDKARCARIVNASELQTDVRNRAMPNFSLYVPDLNNDGHDTGVAYADMWLADSFGPLLNNPAFSNGLLFIVTFDESQHLAPDGNHVWTIIAGEGVTPGTRLDAQYDHYSLLRLIEDELGLGTLGQGDLHANAITRLR